MCDSPSGISMTRELCMSCGKIVHCQGCGSVGFEFGTSYMIFDESDFLRFANWMQGLTWKSTIPGKNKLYVQVQGDKRVMLGLTRSELRDISVLCEEAVQWLPEGALSAGHTEPLQSMSGLVH